MSPLISKYHQVGGDALRWASEEVGGTGSVKSAFREAGKGRGSLNLGGGMGSHKLLNESEDARGIEA